MSRENIKLLIVEDDEIIRRVLDNFAVRKGWEVNLAEDGRAAINAYEKEEYDVIIMDCQMPVFDGYETTGEIRQLESRRSKHTPIIALTADASEGSRETCLNAGMDDYLTKPIEVNAFYDIVEKWTKSIGE